MNDVPSSSSSGPASDAAPQFSSPSASELLRSPLTFDDVVADLVWPRLLRATSLALVPQRLVMSLFLVALLWLVISLGRGAGVGPVELGSVSLTDPGSVAAWVQGTLVSGPLSLFLSNWIVSLLTGVLLLVSVTIFGGAICRSAALDAAQNVTLPWPRVFAFSLERWRTVAAVIAGPLVMVWLFGLGLAVVGWLLFSVPVLNVIGGLLFGAALLLSFVSAVILVAYVLVHPILIPCVACESADAFDALSRGYEFLFNRPLRFVLYVLVLIVQGVVAVGLALVLITLAERFAVSMASAWVGESGAAAVAGMTLEDAGRTWNVAGAMVSFWIGLMQALVAAFTVSYFFCASTLLYLALRRLSDGQDMSEIWVPGLLEGTMAESVGE